MASDKQTIERTILNGRAFIAKRRLAFGPKKLEAFPQMREATVNDLDPEFVNSIQLAALTGFGTHYQEIIRHVLKHVEVVHLGARKSVWEIQGDCLVLMDDTRLPILKISWFQLMASGDKQREVYKNVRYVVDQEITTRVKPYSIKHDPLVYFFILICSFIIAIIVLILSYS
jgi:hypothetical protein